MISHSSPVGANDPHYLGGIGDWPRFHAERNPEQEAIVFGELRLSYREFNTRINQAANALASHGIGKGDRVAILLLNSNTFLEVFFACAKLGAIAVPLNYRLSPAELLFILNDAQAEVLVCHQSLKDLITPIYEQTALKHVIIATIDGEEASGGSDYEQVIAKSPDTEPTTLVVQNDPLMMMYTSGTTGKPKGALLSHANPTWVAVNTMLSDLAVLRNDTALTVAPLFHIGGLAIHTLPALYIGATMVLHAQFNPVETLRTVERERVNVLFLLPAMWQALTLIPDFDEHDLSSLRYLISGGENVYPTEVEQVLYRHPKVQEVAVIGVPDETWGEVPMALIVPKPGERLTLEEMEEFCRDKLARFKTPKHLAEISELPRTATGKILKRELRKQFAET